MFKMNQIMPHLPYLAAVWKHGSFTAAAAQMQVSQAAISYQIRQLEEKLGAKLVVRQSGSKPTLTAGALTVLETYKKAENQLRHALEGAAKDPTSGTLRLSAPVDFGSLVMPWVIAELNRLAPRLKVELEVTDTIADLLEDGFDCAIRTTNNDQRLSNEPIFTSRAILVSSKGYAENFGLPKKTSDLQQHQLLLRKKQPSRNLGRLLSSGGIDPTHLQNKIVLSNTFALVEAVKAGLGIGLLPQFSLQPHLFTGELVAIELAEEETFQSQFYLSFPRLPQNAVRLDLLKRALDAALAALHFNECFALAD